MSPGARGPLWARLQYPLVAALLLGFLLLGWHGRVPAMLASGDDEFKYIALSKSLETGSYREIYRPTAPLHVQYPPAYPAWLAVVRQVTGESLDGIRVANLLLVASALLLWFGVARSLMAPGLALSFLFLLSLNRGLLLAGGSLGSEGLFLLLSTAALAATASREAERRRILLGAIAVALLAFLTRSIGLAAVGAVGVWLWSRGRRGALAFWAAMSALVVGGWFVYTSVARSGGSVRSYLSEFRGESAEHGGALQMIAERGWNHGVGYATTDMPYLLSLPGIRGTLLDNWAWLLATAVLLTAGFVFFWRRWPAAAAYVAFYVGLVLIWPARDGRLIIPLLPLGLLAFLLGARWLTQRLPAPAHQLVLGALIALPALGALKGAQEHLSTYRECDRINPYASAGCYDKARLALAASAEYLRGHAAPTDVVITREPASMHFLSGRRAEPLPLLLAAPPGTTADSLRSHGIRFALVTRPWIAQRLLDSCRELQVAADYSPEALLLAISPPGSVAPDACRELTEMSSRFSP